MGQLDRALTPAPSERHQFLWGLDGLMRSFLEAEVAGAITSLEQLCVWLESRASELGYVELAACALRVRVACARHDSARLNRTLDALIDAARRAFRETVGPGA
jgi:hypothetical protein